MNRNTIEKILNFLKEKEGRGIPQNWNLIDRLETYPDDIQYIYEGDLGLSGSNIKKLPNDLYVRGYLSLTNCKQLIKLPTELRVWGFLSLTNCNQLTELPDNLYVSGRLFLIDCKQITKLPDKLYVGRDLHITNTPLAKKYTDEQIYEIVESTGGKIGGQIIRE